MSFFDDVINTTKNAAQTAGKKTDEAVRFTKLKIKESQTSSDIKAHFEKLGQMAYEMKKAENPDAALFDAEIEEIPYPPSDSFSGGGREEGRKVIPRSYPEHNDTLPKPGRVFLFS